MEPEGILRCSQEPATGLYPGTHASCPHARIPCLLRFILILSPIYAYVNQEVCSLQVFRLKFCVHFVLFPMRTISLAHLIVLDLFTVRVFYVKYKLKKTAYYVSPGPHYVHPPFGPNI
jgi:hypothetical protein